MNTFSFKIGVAAILGGFCLSGAALSLAGVSLATPVSAIACLSGAAAWAILYKHWNSNG